MLATALYVREAEQLFGSDGRLADQATRDSLQAVLVAFGKWIELTRGRFSDQCQARAAANALP